MSNRFRAVALAMLFVVSALFVSHGANAEPLDPKQIPEPLKPWTAWALGDQNACPTLYGSSDQVICAWPARLDMTLDDHGGHFVQTWHVDQHTWISLPGDSKRWPFDVKIDGARAVVVERSGLPQVAVAKGEHKIEGSLAWDTMPESIHVPPETGLLALTVRGAAIAFPNRDAAGQVFLAKTETAEEGERLEIIVHRRIDDGVPVNVTTHVILNVAGKNREVVLGKAMLDGFMPTALNSPLPARVEPDSHLRVQVRPGHWVLELQSRSTAPITELKRNEPEGPWREGDEVWTFQSNPVVRAVSVEGVSAIDPQQTSLPDDWKKLPAYPVRLGDVMKLVEKRRGDTDVPPDRLTLSRNMWLDFDGQGFTTSDTITGSLERATRLEMEAPTVLGRVAIGGRDQFITLLKGKDGAERSGVEVRQGALNVSADSRLIADPSDVPAVGWAHDFHQVTASLHLPPGYRLFHATGIDEVPGTWVKHWTLLEIFLALVLALAIGRLRGPAWGLIAAVTFALTFPEGEAPKWVWVGVLAIEAVTRALPDGIPFKILSVLRAASLVVVVLVGLPFMIDHVRTGMYPALDDNMMRASDTRTGESQDQTIVNLPMAAPMDAPPPGAPVAASTPAPMGGSDTKTVDGDFDRPAKDGEKENAKKTDESGAATQQGQDALKMQKSVPDRQRLLQRDDAHDGRYEVAPTPTFAYQAGKDHWKTSLENNAEVYDPNASVQTGPGVPRWSWTTVPLQWSGPVERTQRMHLYLLTPPMNLALALLRAALLCALVLRFARGPKPKSGGSLFGAKTSGGPAVAGVAAAIAFALFLPGIARADIPSKDLLDELARRLSEKPECLPTCATADRMAIDASKKTLRIRFEVGAVALTAIPLPGDASQWSPQTVLIDGQAAKSLARTSDGKLWVSVAPGAHQIQLEGVMPARDSVQLSLPMHPHRVESTTDGWTLAGVHEDGLADDNLQLTRNQEKGPGATLEPGALPPFVRIERTLSIGLTWQVETHIYRTTPAGIAVVLEVPLLQGESVTTADVRVVGGKALVNMAPTATEVFWTSVLAEKSPIELAAPKTTSWVEVWRVDASPIWHTEATGIAPVDAGRGAAFPEWRPWPGEKTTIDVTRPAGIPGNTFTIDSSDLQVSPGVRSTDATLDMTVRSSRGAEHVITLPDGAELEQVQINGNTQSIRQEGRKVTLPLVPGSQQVRISFRTHDGLSLFYRAPTVDLGIPSVNASTAINMATSRWVLFVHGPRLGPAVLFWSHLLVLLAVAFGLSRIRFSHLRAWQWMLLAIGLSQISVVAGAFVVGWLMLLSWRESIVELPKKPLFNIRQLAIPIATVIALSVLTVAVHQGLLGEPEMQIRGNASSASCLHWFQDRSAGMPDAPWAISVPILVYRLTMLAWALWLALSVLRWLRWGWSAFGKGGMWKKAPPPPPRPAPIVPIPGMAPNYGPMQPQYAGAPGPMGQQIPFQPQMPFQPQGPMQQGQTHQGPMQPVPPMQATDAPIATQPPQGTPSEVQRSVPPPLPPKKDAPK